jgi:hypothetical protein
MQIRLPLTSQRRPPRHRGARPMIRKPGDARRAAQDAAAGDAGVRLLRRVGAATP